jgi:hypothetical protein
MFEKLVYTKSSDWSYESEWRISLLLNAAIREDYYDLPFGWNELDAVIFGLRTPTKAITDLIKVSRNCNPLVRFYQIEKTPNLFELKVAAFNRG